MRRLWLWMMVTVVFIGFLVEAAEAAVRALEIQPEKWAEVKNGAVAVVRGSLGPNGQRFVPRNLTTAKPVVLLLLPADPKQELLVSLAQATLENPDREGSTSASGHHLTRFRTAPDATIWVRPARADPARFLMVVWVGDGLKAKAPTQLLSPERRRGSSGSDMAASPALAGGLIVLVLLVGASVFLFRRRARRPS